MAGKQHTPKASGKSSIAAMLAAKSAPPAMAQPITQPGVKPGPVFSPLQAGAVGPPQAAAGGADMLRRLFGMNQPGAPIG